MIVDGLEGKLRHPSQGDAERILITTAPAVYAYQ